jgi:general secretion pathway protein G
MNQYQREHNICGYSFPVARLVGSGCFGYFNPNNRGMTLIEVMIVVVLIGILSSIAIPTYISSREKAKIAATVAEIKILEKMIQAYNIDNNSYPETMEDIGMQTLKDPWGNPYQYLKIEDRENNGKKKKSVGKMRKNHNMVPVNSDFDLYSNGRDGKSQTPFTAKASRDDIVRANNGRFIGLVSGY